VKLVTAIVRSETLDNVVKELERQTGVRSRDRYDDTGEGPAAG
jgi:nitrogen regulatory protein PII